jgi:RNA polymerase sigma factor (sigma-70 family)
MIGARCRCKWFMQASSSTAVQAPASATPFRLSRFGDEALARLSEAGDERAFAALYERYHQQLYRYCRSIVREDTDAQDALQSTFAGALVALRRAQRNAPIRPWLFRIAHNESVTVLRRRHGGCEDLSEHHGQRLASAADRAGDRERFAQLVADLRELPERLRSALLMRELSGLSHAEIAAALGVSLGAAKQTIFEARRVLMEFGEGRAMACEDVLRTISDGDGRALRGRRLRAHMRDCPACTAFALAIPARKADMLALAPPIAPLAAGGVLTRLLSGGSAHGGHGAGVAAAAAGKVAGTALITKAVVAVAVVGTATAGATGVLTPAHRHASHQHATSGAPTTAIERAAPAAGLTGGAHTDGLDRNHRHASRGTALAGSKALANAQSGTPTGRRLGSPTGVPSGAATGVPSGAATGVPSGAATGVPSEAATGVPSGTPTGRPTGAPTGVPSGAPTGVPWGAPTGVPWGAPTGVPSGAPTGVPSGAPTGVPSGAPTGEPSGAPTGRRSGAPTGRRSGAPTGVPSGSANGPTGVPSGTPAGRRSGTPAGQPSTAPTGEPSPAPTGQPSTAPTGVPSETPTGQPARAATGPPIPSPGHHATPNK